MNNGAADQTYNNQSRNPLPIREDCWSEEASATLVEAWGQRHLELNRGNLRQKHWQEVADAVNSRHHSSAVNRKSRRTDVQCKNRIDTLKKKYKVEKAKILATNGSYVSKWPLYDRLDELIGSSMPLKRLSLPAPPTTQPVALAVQSSPPAAPLALPYRNMGNLRGPLPQATVVPVAPRSVREKRPAPVLGLGDESSFRRNYSAVAAAAAAESTDSDEDDDSRGSRSSTERSSRRDLGKEEEVDGVKELANAIERFGEIYEKVEGVKQKQMVELEKERMEFIKSLEFQRMQLFMDWQVQLEKIKRSKKSANSDARGHCLWEDNIVFGNKAQFASSYFEVVPLYLKAYPKLMHTHLPSMSLWCKLQGLPCGAPIDLILYLPLKYLLIDLTLGSTSGPSKAKTVLVVRSASPSLSHFCRNNESQVVGVLSKGLTQTTSFLAECWAIVEALAWQAGNDWHNLWVESDSSSAVQALVIETYHGS
ncbi:hypothetical protein IFM89_031850 [Coptis chinensis]|uniref:Uncharacterized protein n=1 Tax=Coptis chinensis TaxID=261450 RepID=A0A835GZ32_9MAGN|nr:hypothetical protein IFM89_031850 [Coptis chinensis]